VRLLHFAAAREAGAAIIRQFQIGVVPGLLQTADYAEVVTLVREVDPGKVGLLVRLRMQRQSEHRTGGFRPASTSSWTKA
jgi:hypothetical protein